MINGNKNSYKKFLVALITVIGFLNLFNKVVYADEVDDNLEKYKKVMIACCRSTGMFPSIMAGQFIFESGGGITDLAILYDNFFGITWSESFRTKYPGADSCHITGNSLAFTHFPKPEDCFKEYSTSWWGRGYEPARDILMNLNSTRADFIAYMGSDKFIYCQGNPLYGKTVETLIKERHLDEWDKIAFPNGRKFAGVGDDKVGTYSYPDDGFNLKDIKNIVDNSNSDEISISQGITKESDLVGMPKKSNLTEKAKEIDLPSYNDLSDKEKENVTNLRGALIERNDWSLWDTIRVFTVFAGLCMLVYAVLMIACYLFDKTNHIFELSLVGVLSLGKLKFSDEEVEVKGYLNKSKLIKVSLVLFITGFLLIGGSLFTLITNIILDAQNSISG